MCEEETIQERCAGPRHRCYTDEYGNYIDQYSEECDHTCLPYSSVNMSASQTQDVNNAGYNDCYFDRGLYSAENGTECNYGSYSSSSELCSPLYTEMKFFDFPQQYPNEDYQYDPSYAGYSEVEAKYDPNQYNFNQYSYRTDCVPPPVVSNELSMSIRKVSLDADEGVAWNDYL